MRAHSRESKGPTEHPHTQRGEQGTHTASVHTEGRARDTQSICAHRGEEVSIQEFSKEVRDLGRAFPAAFP